MGEKRRKKNEEGDEKYSRQLMDVRKLGEEKEERMMFEGDFPMYINGPT